MKHLLDNPAYNALISGNKNLSNGTETVKYFAKGVAQFVGIKQPNLTNFERLFNTVPYNGVCIYTSPETMVIPSPWKTIACVPGFQMVFNNPRISFSQNAEIILLNESNVPEMLALTKLTNPGPFLANTIAFGNYKGIFVDDKLVAMAGQRLHVFNFVEISAVCTHPDYWGKGYAKELMQNQMMDIQANGEIPFLHVKSENERAINIYKQLGFEIRKEVFFYIIEKKIEF